MNSKLFRFFLLTLVFLFLVSGITAQSFIPEVRVSPQASISQNVGFATVEINYSRPAVKGREIWGKLVPFGVNEDPYSAGIKMPWRAGADENTTISLSHEAKINGQLLPAGTYGLHIIVEAGEWTIIFNKDNKAWGSYFYNENNDILRVKAKPETAEMQEWLTYGFDDLTTESCTAFLRWEKIKLPFKIEFDKNKIVIEKYSEVLMGDAGFYSNNWRDAARYCLDNNTHLETGLAWVEKAYKSIRAEKFSLDVIKAGLLEASGKEEESKKLLDAALKEGKEEELTDYCRGLIQSEQMEKASVLLDLTLSKYPDSWLANYYSGLVNNELGNKEMAKSAFEKALKNAPESRKGRIEKFIKDLQ